MLNKYCTCQCSYYMKWYDIIEHIQTGDIHTHTLSVPSHLLRSPTSSSHTNTQTMGSHLHVEQNSLLLFTLQMLRVDMMTLAELITSDWTAARGPIPRLDVVLLNMFEHEGYYRNKHKLIMFSEEYWFSYQADIIQEMM